MMLENGDWKKYEDIIDGCIRTEKRLHFAREQENRR